MVLIALVHLSHLLLDAGDLLLVELLELHRHELVVALVAEQNVQVLLPFESIGMEKLHVRS